MAELARTDQVSKLVDAIQLLNANFKSFEDLMRQLPDSEQELVARRMVAATKLFFDAVGLPVGASVDKNGRCFLCKQEVP